MSSIFWVYTGGNIAESYIMVTPWWLIFLITAIQFLKAAIPFYNSCRHARNFQFLISSLFTAFYSLPFLDILEVLVCYLVVVLIWI